MHEKCEWLFVVWAKKNMDSKESFDLQRLFSIKLRNNKVLVTVLININVTMYNEFIHDRYTFSVLIIAIPLGVKFSKILC